MAVETSAAKSAARAEAREPAHPHHVKSWLRDYFESIVIAVVLALFVRTFVVQTFKIPSSSMEDTLLIGDHILVNKFVFAPHSGVLDKLLPYGAIKRGDVLVFKWPKEPDKDFIKRVIGLPGDTIELRDGRLYRNNEHVDEPYIFIKPPKEDYRRGEAYANQTMAPVKVPDGQYFMMGDNRLNSYDSRGWGFVPRANVKGRALLIYWSFNGPGGEQTTMRDKVAVLAEVAIHFFDRTRWSRTFRVVR